MGPLSAGWRLGHNQMLKKGHPKQQIDLKKNNRRQKSFQMRAGHRWNYDSVADSYSPMKLGMECTLSFVDRVGMRLCDGSFR